MEEIVPFPVNLLRGHVKGDTYSGFGDYFNDDLLEVGQHFLKREVALCCERAAYRDVIKDGQIDPILQNIRTLVLDMRKLARRELDKFF